MQSIELIQSYKLSVQILTAQQKRMPTAVQSIELIQSYKLSAQILTAQQNRMLTVRSLLDMLRSGIHSKMGSDVTQDCLVYKSLTQPAIACFGEMPLLDYLGALREYFSLVSLVKWIADRLVLCGPSIRKMKFRKYSAGAFKCL